MFCLGTISLNTISHFDAKEDLKFFLRPATTVAPYTTSCNNLQHPQYLANLSQQSFSTPAHQKGQSHHSVLYV